MPEFCSARNDPKGQGTILASALCVWVGLCDQHVMQHQMKDCCDNAVAKKTSAGLVIRQRLVKMSS